MACDPTKRLHLVQAAAELELGRIR
jgi:hypothetical protein